MIEFRAPYPPSVNRYWRTVNGRPIISRDGRAYKEQVFWLAKAAGFDKPTLAWVEVSLTLHPVEPKDSEKRAAKFGPAWHLACRCIDIDNACKAALDALQGAAFANDSQILTLLVLRGAPVPDGGLTVKVKETEWQAA